jgi:hypothetical protein
VISAHGVQIADHEAKSHELAVTPSRHHGVVDDDTVSEQHADCTCDAARDRTLDQQRFEVAPAPGGGWVAWAVSFGRLLARLIDLPTHCVVVTQRPNQRYVQVMLGDGRAHLEASGNEFLEGDFRLGETEHEHLHALGFDAPDEGAPDSVPNWWMDHPDADPFAVADLLTHTMVAVMGFDDGWPVTIELFGADQPCAVCAWGSG